MVRHSKRFWLALFIPLLLAPPCIAEDLREDARKAMKRAVEFYSTKVAAHGGYVYRYSHDLVKREGEGKTDLDTVWCSRRERPPSGWRSSRLTN